MSKEKFSKRTVFNHDNEGHKTGGYEIFMDEFLGLYDTINIRYPVIDDLYKLQRSCIWTEDEVNLEQSRMDMMPIGKGGKTRQEEIDILTKAVSYLWEADSVASRSVLSIFAPYITNSEATAMFSMHTLMEIIHSESYSEIVRQCNMNPQKLIEDTVKNEEITGRMDLITEAFDELIYMGSHYSIGSDKYTKKEHRQTIIKALMALYLLERVQFMSSFVVVFGLAEHDKFKGIADIVRLIARDELCHASMIATVLNIIRNDNQDWDDDFNELLPEILKMVDEVVQHEFKWNEYLFSEGRSMVGLNAPLLNEWVLWCAKDMCDRINIPYNYKVIKENPLSWTDNWFEFDAIQNANQEADNTNYRLNAVENDLDEEEVFDI